MISKKIFLIILMMSSISDSYGRFWFKEGGERDSEDLFEELLDHDQWEQLSSSSDNLKDQANVWSKFEGYYTYKQYFYDKDMTPQYFGIYNDGEDSERSINEENSSASPSNKGSSTNTTTKILQYFPAVGFANFTIVGSRVYKHNYLIFPRSDNSDSNSNSVASAQDSWETSTYYKDGKSVSRGGLLGLYTGATQLHGVGEMVYSAIDDRTIYGRGYTKGGLFSEDDILLTETIFCLDEECSQISITQDQFKQKRKVKEVQQQALPSSVINTTSSVRTVKTSLDLRKVSKSAWIDQMNDDMDKYNVLEKHRVPTPMINDCLNRGCESFLTEEWWCETDPSCSNSGDDTDNTSGNNHGKPSLYHIFNISMNMIEPSLRNGVILVLIIFVILTVLLAKSICLKKQNQRQHHHQYSRINSNTATGLV